MNDVPLFEVPATRKRAPLAIDITVRHTVHLTPEQFDRFANMTGENELGEDHLTYALMMAVDDVLGFDPANEWTFAPGTVEAAREELRHPRWVPIEDEDDGE